MRDLKKSEIKECSGCGFWSFIGSIFVGQGVKTVGNLNYDLNNHITPYGTYDNVPNLHKNKNQPLYYA
jgi:hypothetical protein